MISDLTLARLAAEAYTQEPTFVGSNVSQNIHVVRTLIPTPGSGAVPVYAVRGSAEPADWVLDFAAIPTLMHAIVDDRYVGVLHAGIAHAADSVFEQVRADHANYPGPFALTGHSMGGGIALIMAAWFAAYNAPLVRTVTFAAPRVGLLGYHHVLRGADVTEYKFGNDIVPQLPTFLLHARKTTNIGAPSINPLDCHPMARYLSAIADLPAEKGLVP